MLSAIRLAFGDARIRAVAIALALLGLTYASTVPYQSIIATQQLGMDERHFGFLIFVIGLAGMIGNILLGYFSDLAANRKTAVLVCLGIGALGFGAFALRPGMESFILCMLLIYPMANSAYGLLFGTVRSLSNDMAPGEGGSVNAAVRSFYALSWIVMPALVGVFIAWTTRASDSFAIAASAFLLGLAFYWRFGPDVAGNSASAGSALANLQEAARLVLHRGRLARLTAVSLINSPHPLVYAVFPLLMTQELHGSMAQLGVFAGFVAFLEIPIMLGVGTAVRRMPTWQVIVTGGLVHAGFLLGLTGIGSSTSLFALAPLNAFANAVLLTQHLTYAQDLLPDRPGLGSSLLSLISLISRGAAALVFAGIGFYGIIGALVVGALIAMAGCVALAMMDARRGRFG